MTKTVGLEETTQTVGLEEMTQTVGLEETTQQLQSIGLVEQAISVPVCAVCVEPKPAVALRRRLTTVMAFLLKLPI